MRRWWLTMILVGLAVEGVALVPRWLGPAWPPPAAPAPVEVPPVVPAAVVAPVPVVTPVPEPVPVPVFAPVRSGRDELLVLGVDHQGSLETYLVDAGGISKVGDALATPTASGWWTAYTSGGSIVLRSADDPARSSVCDPSGGEQFDQVDPDPIDEEVGTDIDIDVTHQTVWFLGSGLFTVQQAVRDVTAWRSSVGTCAFGEGGWVPVDVAQAFGDDGAVRVRAVGAPLNRWGLSREHGEWVLSGFTLTFGEATPAPTAWVPPTSITGQPGVPDLRLDLGTDVLASPSGSFRLIVGDGGFRFTGPDRQFDLPLDDRRVVSTQWALGSHAARWRSEVPALFAR